FFPVPCGSVSGRRTTHSVFVLQPRWTLCLKGKNEPSKELPKFSVKLFLRSSGHVIISVIRRKRKVLGEISNYKVQLEVVKAKIKSAKSKDESESLKFTQKNLINK
ncbi:hypothetical protein S245_002486, partial [Arachis hypogaea]